MTPIDVRNAVIPGLHAFTGRCVVLSDQTVPEGDYPHIYYQYISPHTRVGGENATVAAGQLTSRWMAEATISISACGIDREDGDTQVYGDDDALQLCMLAHQWFYRAGRDYLQAHGIAVVDLSNSQNRTAVEVDQVVRRYGFDVRLRYEVDATYPMPSIEGGTIINL